MQSKIDFFFFQVNKIFFQLDITTLVAMTLAALIAFFL